MFDHSTSLGQICGSRGLGDFYLGHSKGHIQRKKIVSSHTYTVPIIMIVVMKKGLVIFDFYNKHAFKITEQMSQYLKSRYCVDSTFAFLFGMETNVFNKCPKIFCAKYSNYSV